MKRVQKEQAVRGRIVLEPGNVIVLKKDGEQFGKEEFSISKVEGCGGSAVCYCACLDGKNGKLKEFYPADIDDRAEQSYYAFKRSKSNQLIPVGCYTSEMFARLKDDFVATHRLLEKAKSDNAVLNNYMHSFELFYGYENGECASVYIWTPDDYAGVRYDKFIEENYALFSVSPLKALKNIVQSVKTLSEGICALHFSDFYHLDINPTNFMLKYKGDGTVDTGAVYLFDLNSINLMDSESPLFAGTKGYIAPEVYYGNISVRADIYSIGATMYSSLFYSEEKGEARYDDSYYNKIKDIVNNSEIMAAAYEKNGFFTEEIKSGVCDILRCCLAKNRNNRYKNCEMLIEQLESLLNVIVTADYLGSVLKK